MTITFNISIDVYNVLSHLLKMIVITKIVYVFILFYLNQFVVLQLYIYIYIYIYIIFICMYSYTIEKLRKPLFYVHYNKLIIIYISNLFL